MSSSEYDSEYDSDSQDNYSEIVYEDEEASKTRFCIALCHLYNVKIHGPSDINGHYLVSCRYKILHMDWIQETTDFMHIEYQVLNSYHHDLFPNYRNIVLQENYIKPEIVEYFDKNGCCVAIIKTFWIKIIQRAWKKVMKNRQDALKHRQKLFAIRYKEINGKWPIQCYAVGGLIGLLRLHR
jgi:hypothetical protein